MSTTTAVPPQGVTMLYEFKSKAAGSVVMTGPVAERLLAIVGKAPGPKGVFTVEQLAPAIAALQSAIEREKSEGAPPESEAEDGRRDAAPAVTLAQRAWPLMELLRAAGRAEQVVTWGV
jgi:uncharacterized small protein (DUF1192 family)